MLALPSALRRLYFKENGDEQQRALLSSILTGGLIIMCIVGVVSMFLGPVIVAIIPTDLPDFYPYFAYAIGFQLLYQFMEYRLTIFQIHQRPVPYALMHIAAGLLIFGFAAYFLAIRNGGASGYLLGRLVAMSFIFAAVVYGLRRLVFAAWSRAKFRQALEYSTPLVPHVLAMILLNFADRFMLKVYGTSTEIGLYTLAYTLGLTMYLVTVAFNMAWGPFFFQTADRGEDAHSKIFDLAGKAVSLSTAVAIFGVVISEDFVYLVFAEVYQPAAPIVPLIIGGYLMFFLYSMFSFSILHKNETRWIAPITISAAAINIVLNSLLIPIYGMTGAAWATFISFGLMAAASYVIAVSVLPLAYPAGRILKSLGLFSAVMAMSQVDDAKGYIIYASGAVALLILIKFSLEWPRFSHAEK